MKLHFSVIYQVQSSSFQPSLFLSQLYFCACKENPQALEGCAAKVKELLWETLYGKLLKNKGMNSDTTLLMNYTLILCILLSCVWLQLKIIHILETFLTCTKAIIWLSNFQWTNLTIMCQCLTWIHKKRNKKKCNNAVCIFHGICCRGQLIKVKYYVRKLLH